MCQDGEVSISRFNGDLCSSWKPCESMTARQIKPPCPGLLRRLNWHWLRWLCPNHQLCFSSSVASSWTEKHQTIDTLHIFQQQTCYWSRWLWTLLSFSLCWCGWNKAAMKNKQRRSQRKVPAALYTVQYLLHVIIHTGQPHGTELVSPLKLHVNRKLVVKWKYPVVQLVAEFQF